MWCLGINDGNFHDHSACIFHNGELLYFVEEERLSRQKNAKANKRSLSVQACLNIAGLQIEDIDTIAVGGDPLYLAGKKTLAQALSFLGDSIELAPILDRVQIVDHHLAHASSAYRTSSLASAIVIVADGSGDGKSFSVYHASDDKLYLLEEKDITQSLGWMFEAATTYLGLGGFHHAGKTMALAPFGTTMDASFMCQTGADGFSVSVPKSLLKKAGQLQSRNMIKRLKKDLFQHYFKQFESLAGRPSHQSNRVSSDLLSGQTAYTQPTPCESNVAALVQSSVTDCIHAVLKKYLSLYDVDGICFAGGLALNCRLMGSVVEAWQEKRVYVPPVANDTGLSMGAAFEALSQTGIRQNVTAIRHPYWGDGFDDDEMYHYLQNLGLSCQRVASPSSYAADQIADGKTVIWFQGRMEGGPRALGNRSILARPDRLELKDKINKQIKNREPWRPFAPSTTTSGSKQWLHHEHASPFMSVALPSKNAEVTLAGVSHIDKTSRVQVVDRHMNPRYHRLITKTGSITGQEVVLNTSLNISNMPIAHRPYDALCVFFGTPVDAAVFGDTVVFK